MLAATEFSPTDGLIALVTIEALVFAALGIAVAMILAPGRERNIVGGELGLLVLVNGLLIVIAVGAGFAWAEIYGPAFPRQFSQRAVAGALIAAIVSQPVVGIVLSTGVRAKP